VLQVGFEIIKRFARSWFESNLTNILMVCVVLHNMILEDEREEFTLYLRVETHRLCLG
jgi:Plant transposon protein